VMEWMRRAAAAAMLMIVTACGGGGSTVGDVPGGTTGGGGSGTPPSQALALGEDCSAGAGKGWCWQYPLPAPHRVTDVAFADALKGWAVGAGGYVLRSTDGGATWVRQSMPVDADLVTVKPVDGDRAWAVTVKSHLLFTSDGGVSWRIVGTVPLGRIRDMRLHGEQTLIVNGDLGSESLVSVVSPDGGKSWESVPSNFGYIMDDSGAFWSVDPSRVLQVWRPGSPSPQDVLACTYPCNRQVGSLQDPAALVVFTADSGFWEDPAAMSRHTSSDGGRTWTRTAFVPPAVAGEGRFVLHGFDRSGRGWAHTLLFVAHTGGGQSAEVRALWRTTDAGRSWTRVSLPVALDLSSSPTILDHQSVSFQTANSVEFTLDAGQSWATLVVPGETALPKAVKLEAGRVLIAGFGEWSATRWYASRDGGVTWSLLPGAFTERSNSIFAPHFFDADTGVVHFGAQVLRTTDGGRAWEAMALPGVSHFTASLHFTADGTGWVVGDGMLFRSDDRGSTWIRVTGNTRRLNRASFADGRAGWATESQCDYGGLVQCTMFLHATVDGGRSWQPLGQVPGDLSTAVQAIDERQLVMTGEGGIRYSADAGRTWTQAAGAASVFIGSFRFIPGTSGGWFMPSWSSTPLRTRDAGRTWTEVALPAEIGSVHDLSFSDPLNGWLVGSEGIARTSDGGQTWTRKSGTLGNTLYGVFALDPKRVWLTGSAILATETAGE